MAALLEMKGIHKSFSGVRVLDNVDFSLEPGEVHALMGENGAGKSTLMKILGGIYRKDEGSITIKGKPAHISSPFDASNYGIAMIHQELNLVPHLTVMENIFLGREITFGKTKWIHWRKMKQQAAFYLFQLGMEIDPGTVVGELSVGQQQMVEIAKALSIHAEILVLDEPTAALTDREIEALFQVIKNLREKGVGMVYVSHRMEEIFKICDRISILRDGHYIGTKTVTETNMDGIVKMMVGREIKDRFPKMDIPVGSERLRVENLSVKGKVHDVSLTVHAGEILGIAGLMGAGRTELAKALFGAEHVSSGKVLVDGIQVSIRKPADAIREGIALVTEDRKEEGLVLSMSVRNNISLPSLGHISSYGFIRFQKEGELAAHTIKTLGVKTAGSDQMAGSLSGGNQQKVVIGKWLATHPKVLILDEPTRGVDIGAKKEIYDLMNGLACRGVAIIMISSELPEVLGMSDRILVMHEGRMTGAFSRADKVDQEDIMRAATGRGNIPC